MCTNGGGPVEDGQSDTHCMASSGDPIVQTIGKCTDTAEMSADTAGAGGAGGAAGASGDEAYTVLTSHQGADDDCKYDVSFTTSCVTANQDVTFRVTLTSRADRTPATGAHPDSPEIFLADNPSHISPSIGITTTEDPPGTYAIGPVDFDQSGRWVVRFHFYESCSDVPADSPHGHIAFYIDVP